MEINLHEVHQEITDAFWHYVNAIVANEMDAVINAFWHSEHVLRYGTGENLYGIEAIVAFRNSQRGNPIDLDITHLVITAFGRDFGTANCEMRRSDTGGSGRMSHTWVRLPEGWRIVAAHVSSDPRS